jgi:hypothetical protein
LSIASAAQLPNAQGMLAGSLVNISIANSTVVKDYNAFEMIPGFNPKTTGIALYDSATATNRTVGPNRIPLESPPVLPPNQGISISLEVPPTGTVRIRSARKKAGRMAHRSSALVQLNEKMGPDTFFQIYLRGRNIGVRVHFLRSKGVRLEFVF